MSDAKLARAALGHFPTPLERMARLSKLLNGPELLVKRDDLTGLAFGGNKTRKLELLVGAAESSGARTLVTRGAVQSNHCRQTAAAAARLGLACILVLGGTAPRKALGNLFLDELLGAELVWTEGRDPDGVLEQTLRKAEEAGRNPYLIPYGGSSPLGASAYADALRELMEQDAGLDLIVLASSSGGTQAGLVAGARLHGFRGRILGISVEPRAEELRARVTELANAVLRLRGDAGVVSEDEVEVTDEFLGAGYAAVGDLEREAIATFARTEGLLVDPVYTGRAAGGLLQLIRAGRIGRARRIVFWHTGGTPALFAYPTELASIA